MAVIVKAKRKQPAGPEPTYAALHRVADRNVTGLARAFLAAFDRLRDMHSEDDWEQAVGRGTWPSLVADLERISFVKAINPAELDPLANMLVKVAIDAGTAMIDFQGLDAAGVATITNSFTVVNPLAVHWAEQYAAQLVSGIVVESQQAIRGIISRAMTEGGHPRDTAQLIRHTIGLNQRQVGAIGNYRAGLVADGVDPDRIERLVQRRVDRNLRDRALTISRTETMSAANHGQQLLWGEMRNRGLLDPGMRKVFIVTHDDRLCSRCVALDGQTVEVLSGRFTEEGGRTVQQPPVHPRCRCTTGLVEGDEKPPADTTRPAPPKPAVRPPRPADRLTPEQRAALAPAKRYNAKLRGETEAALRSTESGGHLADAINDFQHEKNGVQALRAAITKERNELGSGGPKAQAMLDAIRNAPVDDQVLWRGMRVKTSQKALLEQYAEGATIDMNLSSFSSSAGCARTFAEGAGSGGTKVIIGVVGKHKALPIQNLAKTSSFFSEKELITGGRFRVLGAEKQGDTIVISLQQTGLL